GAFLGRSGHSASLPGPATHDVLVGALISAGAIAERGLAPGRLRAGQTDGCTAFAAAVRVVDRVHHRTAHLGAAAPVARPAGLAPLDGRVFDVVHLADGAHALDAHTAHLA